MNRNTPDKPPGAGDSGAPAGAGVDPVGEGGAPLALPLAPPPAMDLFELGAERHGRGYDDLSLFAGRSRYRRRRLVDAARALPALGLLLWSLPLLWAVPEDKHSASGGLIYLFGVWCGLILVSGLLIAALGRGADAEPPGADGPDQGGLRPSADPDPVAKGGGQK